MSETVQAWPAAVGPEIARHAWPARFQRDGTLIVHTADAIWAFELGHRAAAIAERLPGTPKLTFVAGPLPEPAGSGGRGGAGSGAARGYPGGASPGRRMGRGDRGRGAPEGRREGRCSVARS